VLLISQEGAKLSKRRLTPVNQSYEMMYILRPDLGEEQVDNAIARYKNLLQEQGGDQIDIQHRGKRRLAYEIDRFREGIYVQMNYQAPGTHVAVIERTMRLSEEVIRYLTLRVEAPTEGEEEAPVAARAETPSVPAPIPTRIETTPTEPVATEPEATESASTEEPEATEPEATESASTEPAATEA
jgi:small subunit ribosomal protein S6